ncbi:MAG: hypothetical protein M1817_003832 [Caeruleum heppii]|nr:MAG: hypothetical protein M1817_003832 [Caeruleum heppii]
MSAEELSRMFMPRKSAQRTNSSSSLASSASSTSTISQPSMQTNGVPSAGAADTVGWSGRKKPARGLWPSSKAEPVSAISTARPQSVTTSGVSAATSMAHMGPPSSMSPSQQMLHNQQQNGVRNAITPPQPDNSTMLYLTPVNGTFERKTILVPLFPEVLRIGRQTNLKTLPTAHNGYFDSKVLSRQHAEIWSDRTGKVWIRDVKSSNGTFVNTQRLSAENRDSEPHELREGDTLELGIDIVSEDQKSVVHHKVAARVEHAGFYGNSTNVIDLNFGDIDPTSGGGMMAPSMPQNGPHPRGRTSSHGSSGSNVRAGPTHPNGVLNAMNQQRLMNFWLTPVTVEQIVKRLSTELKAAKQQSLNLQRTGKTIDGLLSRAPLNDEPPAAATHDTELRSPQLNGSPQKASGKAKFTDPPAPPPQHPLPEKPDSPRKASRDPDPQPSLVRSNTERPWIQPDSLPSKSDSSSQLITLAEALASAKKEIVQQSARVQDLEDVLQRERAARQSAEARLKEIGDAGASETVAGDGQRAPSDGTIDRAIDGGVDKVDEPLLEPQDISPRPDDSPEAPQPDEDHTTRLKHRLELMMGEMNEMKQTMAIYKRRVEVAEEESAFNRQSLEDMIKRIRHEDASRRMHREDGDIPERKPVSRNLARFGRMTESPPSIASGSSMLQMAGVQNGKPLGPEDVAALEKAVSAAMAQSHDRHDQLLQSAPYASIFGVVVIGVGLMAFLNGWQKVDR